MKVASKYKAAVQYVNHENLRKPVVIMRNSIIDLK